MEKWTKRAHLVENKEFKKVEKKNLGETSLVTSEVKYERTNIFT